MMMPSLPDLEQETGADKNEYVPGNILEFLEASSRGRPSIPKIRVLPRTFPSTHEMFSEPLTEPVKFSPNQLSAPHRRAPKHTYAKGPVKESATPLAYKNIRPVCSVDGGRKNVLSKLSKSRESSQRTNELMEQVTRGGPASFLEAARKSISYAVSVDNKMEATTSSTSPESSPTAKSTASRRRRGLPSRTGSVPRFGEDALAADAADSIDLFLISKSVAPGASQRVISDLSGDLNDSECSPPQTGPSHQPGYGVRHSMYEFDNAPAAGDQDADLPDRIGQFGGLIPTVYTMDKLDKSSFATRRRADIVAPNRYAGQAISRNTKFTGAGFRRPVGGSGQPGGSRGAAQLPPAIDPSPEPPSEPRSSDSIQDMTMLPGWAGSSSDLQVNRLEKDGALLYTSSQNPLMPHQ